MANEPKVVEGQETQKPEQAETTPAGVQARIDAEVARRGKAEKKLAELQKAQEDAEQKRLEDDKKFKELADGLKVKLTETEQRAAIIPELESAVQGLLDVETEGLTDEQKALIPEGPVHKRLAWITQAKKAGIFAGKEGPAGTFNKKVSPRVASEKWYLDLKADDQKLKDLTMPQYLEWKAFNKRDKVR